MIYLGHRKRQVDPCHEYSEICEPNLSVGRSTTKIYAQVDPTSGRILIDGIDISKIGTNDLRSRLVSHSSLSMGMDGLSLSLQTIIPQVG